MYNDKVWIYSDICKGEFPNWHAKAETLIPSAHRTVD